MKRINFPIITLLLFFITSSITKDPTSENLSSGSNKSDMLPNKFICSGGIDPKTLTKREALNKFKESPCSPTVLLSGVGGNNLVVSIDCKELRKEHPVIFKSCGWNACSLEEELPNKLHHRIPKEEYQIWIPDLKSPMSLFSPFQRHKDCFAMLFGPEYISDPNSASNLKYDRRKGARIYPLGLSKNSKGYEKNKCGVNSIVDFLNGIPNPKTSQYFHKIRNYLEGMGYIPGLTLQAFPYDFRLDAKNDRYQKRLLPVISRLKNLTGKKVTLMGHSLGNIRIASMLWDTSQKIKDSLIENYMAVAPPFLGSTSTILNLVCGNTAFELPMRLGLHMRSFKRTIGSFISVAQLLPSKIFTSAERPSWVPEMLEIAERYKKRELSDVELEFLNLPIQNFKDWLKTDQLENFGAFGGEDVKGLTLDQFITTDGVSDYSSKFIEAYDRRFENIDSLGVPTVLVYSGEIKTPLKLHFNRRPLIATNGGNKFCVEGRDFVKYFGDGDSCVPAATVQLVGLKWMADFAKGLPGAKPVKVFELGGNIQYSNTPFDAKSEQGKKIIKENGFYSLKSDCKKNVKNCEHTGMLFNNELIQLMENLLLVGQSVEYHEGEEMDDGDLEDLVKNCKILTYGLNDLGEEEKFQDGEEIIFLE